MLKIKKSIFEHATAIEGMPFIQTNCILKGIFGDFEEILVLWCVTASFLQQ